jgi:hypothetical protein
VRRSNLAARPRSLALSHPFQRRVAEDAVNAEGPQCTRPSDLPGETRGSLLMLESEIRTLSTDGLSSRSCVLCGSALKKCCR